MATAAQIEANRRNAQMSTGPKTVSGKARASLNSLKHGERAKVVVPVLPQEDPRELAEKIRRWVEDLRTRDDPERGIKIARTKPIPGAGWEGVKRGRERWRRTSD